MFKRRKHFDRSLRYIFWIQAKPRASSRKSHVSFVHAKQRFDTIRAEPFLVQFSLLAKKKGLWTGGLDVTHKRKEGAHEEM